jgi:hypothetical protein
MKNTIKIAFAIVFCLMVGVAANAQTINSGTVDFNVTVLNSFDIRSGGAGTGLNGMSVTGGVNDEAALSATITVSDASPNQDNSVLTASVPIKLRSNAPYKLNATRTGTSVASGPDFESSDISMSISFSARAGALVNTAGADSATAFAGNVGGLSSTATQIASGSRISNGGNTASNDNFVSANLNFSTPRAFYTPTAAPYTDKVTVSILAP